MKRSLTRRERLCSERDIKTLFTRAEKVEGNGIRLFFLRNNREYNRILVTTRRGFNTAIKRNRQKRILREIYRNSKESMKRGFDLAFVLKKEEASSSSLRQEFYTLLENARLLTENGDRV